MSVFRKTGHVIVWLMARRHVVVDWDLLFRWFSMSLPLRLLWLSGL